MRWTGTAKGRQYVEAPRFEVVASKDQCALVLQVTS